MDHARVVLAVLASGYAVTAAVVTVFVFWIYDQAGDS
jgi:hypothetical protein